MWGPLQPACPDSSSDTCGLDEAGGSSLFSKRPVEVALEREFCGEERKGGGLQPPRQPWGSASPGHSSLLHRGFLPLT